jgi:AcrR family transcriptional regulator
VARHGVLANAISVEPRSSERRSAAELREAVGQGKNPKLVLRLPNGTEITVPKTLVQILLASADELAEGHSVAVLPSDVLLTPAEAGELLGPTKTGLSDVATELGVTRQTVYRYFSSTEELLIATAIVAVEPIFGRLAAHCAGIDDPAEIVVESIAYTIERLPQERHLSLLLATGRSDMFTEGVTSPTAMDFGHTILQRFPIDWAQHGYTPADLDELVEFMLRILQSFVLDPGHPRRKKHALRAYLRRWVSPAVVAHDLARD